MIYRRPRHDPEAVAETVDAFLAPVRPEARPAWLYSTGCCDHWTPENGCSDGHTGRHAMSKRAREEG